MHEILWELREHSAGLNCGRWDYIFSFIKKFRNQPGFVLPDRALVTMDRHFLRSYVELLIHTCHRRGIPCHRRHGGPDSHQERPAANQSALEKSTNRTNCAKSGPANDGTWVAHPGLVSIARDVFDTYMPFPNQIEKNPPVEVSAADLLTVPNGDITAGGPESQIST